MLMFSSRLMPPINTRCKLGEFAPKVNQTPLNTMSQIRCNPKLSEIHILVSHHKGVCFTLGAKLAGIAKAVDRRHLAG